MNIKIIITGICALCLCICLYAYDDTTSSPQQIPENSMIRQKITAVPTHVKSFTIVKSETIAFPASWSNLSESEKQLRLFNLIGRISTQKGITYISRRAGYKPIGHAGITAYRIDIRSHCTQS
ncbi:MAG: hypothetical protein WCR31_06770 [Treponema sp.]